MRKSGKHMVHDITCSTSSASYFFLSITNFQRTSEHFAHVPGVPMATKNSLSATTQSSSHRVHRGIRNENHTTISLGARRV